MDVMGDLLEVVGRSRLLTPSPTWYYLGLLIVGTDGEGETVLRTLKLLSLQDGLGILVRFSTDHCDLHFSVTDL